MAEGPIQGLSIGLGLDTTGIDQSLKVLKGRLKSVDSEMKANMSAFDKSERSVEKYETRLGGLNKKLDLQRQAVDEARREHERMVQQHGEGSRQAERSATVYNNLVGDFNNLQRVVGQVSQEFQDFQREQEISNSTFGRLGTTLSETGGRLSKFGDGMKNVGGKMSAFITGPILGLGAGMIAAAKSAEDSSVRIQNTLGITAEEAQKLKEISSGLYKDGFGESLEEVDTALLQTKQNMKDLNETDLATATKSALILADTFDADVNEVTRAGNNLMKGFGIESEEAFDLMAHGAQNGLNFSNEMFDNLSEYSTLFGNMGFSAEEYFELLQKGSEAGVYNLDYVNDVMKEFQIRVKDGSKASTDAMAQLSDETNGVWEAFLKGDGTVKDVSNAVLAELEGMDDQVKANEIGVGLYGTKWEDLEADAMYALGGVGEGLEGVNGSVEKMGENLEKSFGQRLSSIWRETKSALVPFGTVLLGMAEDILPKVSSGVEKVSDFLSNMSPEAQRTAIMFGGIAAAAGPLIAGLGFVASAIGGIMSVAAPLATAIAGAGGLSAAFGVAGTAIMTFATGPVGIAIAAVAGIGIAAGIMAKKMNEDALPEVDRFGNGVSESTQKALGGFFELSDGASQELSTMSITSQEITGEMADNLVGKFAEMNTQILDGMKKRHADELKEMETQFLNSSALTAEREEEILRQEKIRNEMEVVEQSHFQDRIKEIMETAAAEKRELTEIEKETINSIQEEMNKNAVQYLTDNERDQKIILENMKNQADELSAQQAAAVVKNSAKQRDEVIADADKTYNDTISFAIQQRDEAGTISAEEAQKIIDEAKKKRDTTVGHAKSMHQEVVGEAQKQAEGHIEKVDWETGEILSKWDVYKAGVVSKFKATNKESMDDFKRWASDFNTGWNNFNNKAQEIADKYKANVVRKFKETSTESLADFKRWGGNLKDWATDAKDKVSATFDKMVAGAKNLPGRIGSGISSMASKVSDGVKAVSNKLASGLGTGVNGVIGGINWVLGKIGSDSRVPKWEVPKYAHGTDGHPGGLAILGDGRGSNAGRELIQTPSGELSLSPAKDTLMSLPKGAQVLSAKKTKELLGDVPKYANGIGDMLGDLWNGAKGLGKKAVSAAFDVWDYVKNPSKLLNVALGALGISAPSGGSLAGNMAKAGYNKVKDGAVNYVKKKLADFESSAPMAGSGNGFGSPFRLTSRRGMRFHPVTRKWAMHQGDDWGAPAGTLIPAQAAGRVVQSGFHNIRGNYVRVKSGIMERIYQHNTKNLVGVGQNVRKGQAVGTVGSTGRSTGPHLHYEVKKNGVNINPFGLATGGITTGLTASTLHEEGYPEIVIPTAPKRRTDAMKLLAIAGKKIMGNDSSVIRPNQLPNAPSSNEDDSGGVLKALLAATMKQNEILMQLLQKDGNLYMDTGALVGVVGPELEQWNGSNSSIKMQQKGW